MKRVNFDSSGRISTVDGAKGPSAPKKMQAVMYEPEMKPEGVVDPSMWSLYNENTKLQPLQFSNGKTQEDIVRDVVEHIRKGTKLVFVHGACGTGKSAIALNIARQLGRTSIVVPIKSLQRQYEHDYMQAKYVLKTNGKRLRISMITGRENHDSQFMPGVSCADPFLPDTIKLSEKNAAQIQDYYKKNPIITNKNSGLDVANLRRISIAPANPYWSPIMNAEYELKQLTDARKKKYSGLQDKEFIFYHRKEGCSYYDQYQAYIDADVIIFNSAKYKIETLLDRKPATDVEIIDEADEFLDSFSQQEELNVTRLLRTLQHTGLQDDTAKHARNQIIELLEYEEKNKRALGIDQDKIYKMHDTNFARAFRLLLDSVDLSLEISLDEMSYGNRALEIASSFIDMVDETYVSFRRHDDSLYAGFATASISKQFRQMIDKNKAFVFMSGTIHTPEVLRHIFGIENFVIVEAETLNQGSIEIHRTGKEFDCRYSSFKQGGKTRSDYLMALKACLDKAQRPTLIHVQAFEDLPTEEEKRNLFIPNVASRESVKEQQDSDKTGSRIMQFKQKRIPELFTTKCSRGIDFPGDMCRSVVFTKYPNPNIQETFWKVLQQTHPTHFWEFYRDKARREFLQRLYRAIRSKDDHVFVLSPDIRVLEAARELQMKELELKRTRE